MVVHRPLPSFALAVSQIIDSSIAEDVNRDGVRAASPSSESVDLMKTVDCRMDPPYDNDDDYWRYKQQASSDYEDFCNGYYDDDTDTQTLFDEPMPFSHGMKLTRQSHHGAKVQSSKRCEGDRPRANSLRKVPAALKTIVRKIARTKTA